MTNVRHHRLGPTVNLEVSASMGRTLLRACRECGERHPLAIDPNADGTHCLGCGAPVPSAVTLADVDAAMTGLGARIAMAFINAGNKLMRLASRLRSN